MTHADVDRTRAEVSAAQRELAKHITCTGQAAVAPLSRGS
jgi:hypothetical protein